jgi:tetratricopeptide (TPR) repeat protein
MRYGTMSIQLFKELLNELDLAKGKNCLFFVIVDGSPQLIEEKVREHGFTIYEIVLSEEDRLFKLVDILLNWDETEENTLYFVYGIINQAPEILSYLNLHRDFLFDIKRPIIVLGNMYEMKEIATLAPDLWRFRSRTYDFSKKEKRIELDYTPSPSSFSFRVHEAPSLVSWGDEELKRRIDLDEYLLEIIKDDYRRSELYESLATYYFALDDREKFDENLNKFRELRGDREDVSVLYRRLGDICYARRELREAVGYYTRSIELDPGNVGAYYTRGTAYCGLNQFEKAIADYDRVIEIDSDFAPALGNRGNAYSELNQFGKAISDYDKVIEIDPEDALAYNNRGAIYFDLNQVERAIKDYDRALEIDPEYALAYYNRGLAYSKLNQVEKAIKDYDKTIEIDPEYAQAYNNRGLAYFNLNQIERAIKDYDRAIEIDPELPQAYYNRSLAYSILKEFEKAERDYNKAVELDPRLAEMS